MRERSGTVEAVEEVGEGAYLIGITSLDPPRVSPRAGQFVSIKVDETSRRSYSIVSPPGTAAHFEIVIKANPGGKSAELVRRLRPGEPLHYFGPMGYFLYHAGHRGEVLFGATGVGITPILSMVAAAAADPRPPSRVELFWGARTPADLVLLDRVEAIASRWPRFRYRTFLSRAGAYLTGPLLEHAEALGDPRVYLCGSGAMIAEVGAGLVRAGIDVKNRLHTESFVPGPIGLQL